jgi:hypothetical protein
MSSQKLIFQDLTPRHCKEKIIVIIPSLHHVLAKTDISRPDPKTQLDTVKKRL